MPPDLPILNANIQTMDMARPKADAILIRAGCNVMLGSSDDLRACAGAQVRVIGAAGRLVLPGFQDAHVHLMEMISVRTTSGHQQTLFYPHERSTASARIFEK